MGCHWGTSDRRHFVDDIFATCLVGIELLILQMCFVYTRAHQCEIQNKRRLYLMQFLCQLGFPAARHHRIEGLEDWGLKMRLYGPSSSDGISVIRKRELTKQ